MREFKDDIKASKKKKPEKKKVQAETETPAPTADTPPAKKSDGVPGSAITSSRSLRLEGLRLRFLPIVLTIVFGLGLSAIATVVVDELPFRLPGRLTNAWASAYYDHAALLILSLLIITFMRSRVKADFGLHLPRARSYVPSAIALGLFFGVLMTVVHNFPNILLHIPPKGPYRLTQASIIGWGSFQALLSGTSEEVFFRGLLVTYLGSRISGRVSWGRFEMNVAGIIVALIYAFWYLTDFIKYPFLIALAQEICVFGLGVIYAYWFEKSKSLLAPVIGHNLINLTEYVLVLIMISAWR